MEAPVIGKLIDDTAQRDAIHIAIAPVVATERLSPGQHVGLVEESSIGDVEPFIGIVDPYLPAKVRKGERCYLFLYPNTVTSLRHEWTHPAFADAPQQDSHKNKAEAVQWLRDFASALSIDYGTLMEAAKNRIETGEYMIQYGSQSWQDDFYGREQEFWQHYAIATGTRITDHGAQIFSCSC